MKRHTINSFGVLGAALLASGCTTASSTKLQTATDKFASTVDTASNVVLTQSQGEPAHRRRAAIIYLVEQPQDTTNIDVNRPSESFARYVCTGSAAFYRERAFVDYVQKYAKTLKTLTAAPKAGLAEEWARTKAIEEAKPDPIDSKLKSPEDAFAECTKEVVQRDLAYHGQSLTDFTNESVAGIFAGYEAIKALFEAAKGLATAGLKTVNDVEARRRFTAIVTTQHDTFIQNLATGLPPDRLNASWAARRGDALWPAYETFKALLSLTSAPSKPGMEAATARRLAIWELQNRLQDQMALYDALRAATPPGEVQIAVAKAEQQLLDLAQNKDVSVDDLVALLDLIEADLKDVEKQYDAVRKASKFDL